MSMKQIFVFNKKSFRTITLCVSISKKQFVRFLMTIVYNDSIERNSPFAFFFTYTTQIIDLWLWVREIEILDLYTKKNSKVIAHEVLIPSMLLLENKLFVSGETKLIPLK